MRRWFKVKCNQRNSTKISLLRDKYGLEGYGFYNIVTEIIYDNIGDSISNFVKNSSRPDPILDENETETYQNYAEYSQKTWCNLIGISPQTFRKLIKICSDLDLFTVSFEEVLIRVEIPNALNCIDEYSQKLLRKSGQSLSKNRREREGEVEIDLEIDIDKNINIRERGSGGYEGQIPEASLRDASGALSSSENFPACSKCIGVSALTETQSGDMEGYESLPPDKTSFSKPPEPVEQQVKNLPLMAYSTNADVSSRKSTAKTNQSHRKIFSSEIVEFVTRFQRERKKVLGNLGPAVTDTLIYNCCKTVDEMMRLDGFELEEIIAACEWGVTDSFWSQNVCSLAALRGVGRNGRKKIQNLCANYNSHLEKYGPPMSPLDALVNDPKFHQGIIC